MVRSETSTVTSMIQDEEAMGVQLPMSVKERKNRTAKDGSVGLEDMAAVGSRKMLHAASFATCTMSSTMSEIFAIRIYSSHQLCQPGVSKSLRE